MIENIQLTAILVLVSCFFIAWLTENEELGDYFYLALAVLVGASFSSFFVSSLLRIWS